ncbi:hypothetical protein GCM10008995_04350 [Halobellus salinus]|uniref:ABC transporter domain-containing protein n=1 Tax=Halobellus salinus TaxID=931585 RepID=A0A830EJK1_9EURY|nr:ABC transporter ATP-binding protein [Halobellus salinus]GGI97606.1 hypothetical protein GCM10008995_04350 [Halobellus salinus]SMP07290.1 ABC-type multidrug transport system, ATPase component [Halobellus salinus]
MTGESTPLRATGIEQAFGNVVVLSGVSVTADRGEVVAVVGPNGSGKSTLLRILAGVRPPDRGTVALPPAAGGARRLGYLPQRPAFRSGFTARDTLQFYAQLLDGVSGDDVVRTLDRVGLAGVADRDVGSLSGGMTRLLGLGQAVLGNPGVLLLDEPGSGLDPGMVERLFTVVGDLASDGTAVMVASHELPAVETHADTVAVLADGGFRAVDTPAALLDDTDTDSLSAAFLRLVGTEPDNATVASGAERSTTEAGSDTDSGGGRDNA